LGVGQLGWEPTRWARGKGGRHWGPCRVVGAAGAMVGWHAPAISGIDHDDLGALGGPPATPAQRHRQQASQAALTMRSGWSSTREAGERIRIANNRLDELNRLMQLDAADRIRPAIVRLHQAYADARQAVHGAVRDTGNLSQMRALDAKLAPVGAALEHLQDQGMLPTSAQEALPAARRQPPVTSGLGTSAPQPTPTTSGPVATTLRDHPPPPRRRRPPRHRPAPRCPRGERFPDQAATATAKGQRRDRDWPGEPWSAVPAAARV
jgi:hypothetical protein